ncbi:MAG: class II aldolase/adducin family protein [Burkholderiales bacterium]|nr:class II aldolase/adducin family protein [Burkholderiales bacterium]
MRLKAERQAVVDAARRMTESGLVVNTSGNVSILAGDTVVITPSSIAYDTMTAEDVCLVELASGRALPGMLHPSSELPLHLAVYRSQKVNAIVHTHSLYATALTTVMDKLPAIHYQIADLGGSVPVLPYARFGSKELAAMVAAGLDGRTAVLMKNHGATTIGPDLPRALARSITLEWIARLYHQAALLGNPALLDDAEIAAVLAAQRELVASRDRALAERGQPPFSLGEKGRG